MEDLPQKEYELDKNNVLGKGSYGIVYKGYHYNKNGEPEEVAFKIIPKEILNDNAKLQSLSNEIYISSKIQNKDIEKNDKNIIKNLENGNKENKENKDLEKEKREKEEKEKREKEEKDKKDSQNEEKEENKKNNELENIVKFYDIIDIDNDKYLVYEFCNGGDLKRYLRYFRRFDEKMIQNIMIQIIKGLKILHDQKIVHHDIKPENILVELCPKEKDKEKRQNIIDTIMKITDPKNKYLNKEQKLMKDEEILAVLSNSKMKLSDFGLSKLKEDSNTKEVSGSPLYIDPNLFKKEASEETIENEKVDIWALGIIAYELFFYELPFQPFPPSIERLKKAFEQGEYIIDFKKCKQISKQFLSFLNCCLQKEQKIRPPITDLLFIHEFIVREPDYFTYMNIDNYKKAKYPKGNYLKTEGKLTMNINDNRNINAYFDW